jgi:hypothetical protein
MKRPLYKHLASRVGAIANCIAAVPSNEVWRPKHEAAVDWLVKEHLPSGSGFDAGTKIDISRSSRERLVFSTSFHHMDEHGGYAGWTGHEVIVTASLQFGISLRITGRNRNGIKDVIHEAFSLALEGEVEDADVRLAAVVEAA